MAEDHKHEYVVRSFPVRTQRECDKAAAEIERLFNQGWLPATSFASVASIPKNQALFVIFARDKR